MACLLTSLLLTSVLAPGLDMPRYGLPPAFWSARIGSTWVYADDGEVWTEVMTAVEDLGDARPLWFVRVGRVVKHGRVIPWEFLPVSDGGVYRLGQAGRMDDPPVRLLSLRPVRKEAPPTDEEVGTRVEGWEWVVVPAGVYPTLRVRAEDLRYHPVSLAVPLAETRWFVPGVGMVKRTLVPRGRTEPLSERVLKSFTPGKN